MLFDSTEEFSAILESQTPLIGIDYGTSKIGIAISDSSRKVAASLQMLQNTENTVQNILRILQAHSASNSIVVGFPFGYEGGNTALQILKFCTQLTATGINVLLFDEGGTSKFVKSKLKQIHKTVTPKQLSKYDADVAALILQNFLDILNQN